MRTTDSGADTAAEREAWLRLLRTPGVGSASILRLLEHAGSAEAALAGGRGLWHQAGLNDKQFAALAAANEPTRQDQLETDLRWLAQPDRSLVHWRHPHYPPALREIAQPPAALFIHGDAELLQQPQIAIVGARSPTPQGEQNAEAFAAELAGRGLVITSGLALGIDGAAHRGALERGYTLAVCGTGLDRVYPARHKTLAQYISRRGALISEYPPGVGALAENFPRRNRIISALAMGVLVVEAARESGSLITARYALEQGREVFAIPGSIHNPLARGCHALIRQGAKLVETVDDLLEEIAPLLAGRRAMLAPSPAVPLCQPDLTDADEAAFEAVLRAMGDEVLAADELAVRLDLPAAELHVRLTHLELDGRIAQTAGGRYQKIVGRTARHAPGKRSPP